MPKRLEKLQFVGKTAKQRFKKRAEQEGYVVVGDTWGNLVAHEKGDLFSLGKWTLYSSGIECWLYVVKETKS